MKKVVALLLALCMVLTMTAAMAETRQFVMVAASDFEGNAVDVTADPEAFPVLVLQLDDETMTCVFGTEEETAAGSIEIVTENEYFENVEGAVILVATFEDGSTINMQYVGEDETVYVISEEAGVVFALVNIEVLAELEAA